MSAYAYRDDEHCNHPQVNPVPDSNAIELEGLLLKAAGSAPMWERASHLEPPGSCDVVIYGGSMGSDSIDLELFYFLSPPLAAGSTSLISLEYRV
ncbi:MAG: hypothetical protein H0X43_06600 [Nitrosospira sp.]|nr:hypothetical protein [Nitrosospira sp.]